MLKKKIENYNFSEYVIKYLIEVNSCLLYVSCSFICDT